MGELVGAFLLAILAVFIVWESLSKGKREPGASPTQGRAADELALLVLAGVFVLMGLVGVMQPSHPPFSGRSAFLWNLLYSEFGVLGMPLACWVVALVFARLWLALRRKHRR